MTRDEILALSDDELRVKAAEHSQRYNRMAEGLFIAEALPNYPNDIAAAMVLFNEIHDSRSKLYGGAWVLGTVDGGKDCSLATLFFKKKLLSRHRPEKVQAKAKPKQMARAITLAYILAMEGITEEMRYQPEARSSPVRKGTRPGKPPKNPPPPPPEVTK